MGEISTRTLMIAIGCMVADRERILQRIETLSVEVEAAERLAEQIMDIDLALSELGDVYEQERRDSEGYPSYDDLVRMVSEEH